MGDHRLSDVTAHLGARAAAAMPGAWLVVLRRYVLAIAFANLVWETAQLPLYTIWEEGTAAQMAFAVLHCTGGDLLIGSSVLVGTLLVAGDARWPETRFGIVAVMAVVAGVAYVVFSEWLNTEIRRSWAYSEWMPRLPWVGTGLSPLAQWLVIPPLAFWWARRPVFAPAPPTRSFP